MSDKPLPSASKSLPAASSSSASKSLPAASSSSAPKSLPAASSSSAKRTASSSKRKREDTDSDIVDFQRTTRSSTKQTAAKPNDTSEKSQVPTGTSATPIERIMAAVNNMCWSLAELTDRVGPWMVESLLESGEHRLVQQYFEVVRTIDAHAGDLTFIGSRELARAKSQMRQESFLLIRQQKRERDQKLDEEEAAQGKKGKRKKKVV